MKGLKLFFVAAFAVFAVGIEGSSLNKSPTEFDLRLLVETARDLSKIFFKNLNNGLNEAHPSVEKLLNEMDPEAKQLLTKVITHFREVINKEDSRVSVIFKTLVKALDDLKPIKAPCADKQSGEAKKLSNAIERDLVKSVRELHKKYEKPLSNMRNGLEKIIKKARELFDNEIPAIVKCLTPKNKDATKCINTELDKTLTKTIQIGGEIVIYLTSTKQALRPIMKDVAGEVAKQLLRVHNEGRPIINKISDCVANM